jgi:hypothetical protein
VLCVEAILFQRAVQSESPTNELEGHPANQPIKKITKGRGMCKVQFDASVFYLAVIVHKIYCWAIVWKSSNKMWSACANDFPHMQDL